MDLNKIFDVEPYTCFDTSIGRLCLFCLSVKNEDMLMSELGDSIDICGSEKYVRLLVMYTCYPEVSLRNGKYKPDDVVLSISDIQILSQDELEVISGKIIEHYSYLYKRSERRERIDDKGGAVIFFEYTDIEYPKENEENDVDYLYRISLIYMRREKEHHNNMIKELMRPYDFINQIKKTYDKGAGISGLIGKAGSLGEMVKSLKIDQGVIGNISRIPSGLNNVSFQDNMSLLSIPPKMSPAKRTYNRLMDYINKFEKELDSEHEVGVRLVSFGQAFSFHVNNIGYWGPDLITFYGENDQGESLQLIQNISQLSFLLIGVKKSKEKARRIGFELEMEKNEEFEPE
ncbi:MAG: hypothetical protein HGA87_02885 [Desulfobulbaceae bacterium]|nr:hypothetical protein [Desulfobulbaceae bacterium]